MIQPKVDRSLLDVPQICLTYVALMGDVGKVSMATNVDPITIRRLAEEEGWAERVQRLVDMSKSGKPGDLERAINRALNFVQAHQLREVISKAISTFTGMSPHDVIQTLEAHNAKGFTAISGKFLVELAASMEKAHQLTYTALGDTLGERQTRGEVEGSAVSADSLHAAVITALNTAASPKSPTPAALLKDSQIETAHRLNQS